MNILALKYRKQAYICSLQHQMYVYSTGTLAFIVTDSLALQVDDINCYFVTFYDDKATKRNFPLHVLVILIYYMKKQLYAPFLNVFYVNSKKLVRIYSNKLDHNEMILHVK